MPERSQKVAKILESNKKLIFERFFNFLELFPAHFLNYFSNFR